MKIYPNDLCPCGSGKKYKKCCMKKNKNSNGIIKLNQNMGEMVAAHGYELDATKSYIIDLDAELEGQKAIISAIQCMGSPKAMDDWFKWLEDNGFNADFPNPTNDFVKDYYGKKPLWKTDYSLGVVVKAVQDDDYYIVMECSRLNEGYKYTQIILTLGGCE